MWEGSLPAVVCAQGVAMVVRHGSARRLGVVVALALALLGTVPAAPAGGAADTYQNPVSRGFADTFADPAVIRAEDGWWYAYGTTDPLREGERTPHLIPVARSPDLVTWSHAGDVFDAANRPTWAAPDAAFWAPDIRRLGGRYVLYYVVTQTTVTPEPNDNAIGVATAPTPTGPWTDSGGPVVGPRRGSSGNPGDFKWTFDPALLTDNQGTRWLYYGSYYGGIFVTRLTGNGLRAVGEPVMVAIDNRYEGAYVVRRGGFYYLFASEANCCAGPTTGYSVFVGRSTSPTGPFRDRDGISLLDSRVGGTLVISPNGNTWVGTGHNAIVTDLAGQDWFVYHAIDRRDPYLDEPFGINQRPMLLDRLDWIDGWPTVRGGRWASEDPQPAPATTPDGGAPPVTEPAPPPRVGRLLPQFSDEFDDGVLDPAWSFAGEPSGEETGGVYRWPTQPGDLVGPGATASALLRQPPDGPWTVQTRVAIDLGTDDVRNFQQAGLVVHAGDDLFLRLSHVAIWNTRQTEFGKEMPFADGRSWGGMAVGTPAPVTWLRISHRVDEANGEHEYRAASSRDGRHWTWGGVWTLPAGSRPRIGLVSQGGEGAVAEFDYVRVYRP
jgi:arabinan endo-1,5-alpha-L-arabinosidase